MNTVRRGYVGSQNPVPARGIPVGIAHPIPLRDLPHPVAEVIGRECFRVVNTSKYLVAAIFLHGIVTVHSRDLAANFPPSQSRYVTYVTLSKSEICCSSQKDSKE